MKKANQKITCSVYDCMHCNCDQEFCKLEAIKICSCNPDHKKEATMCDSYRKRG